MKPAIMTLNDALWLITAILCVFIEHPVLTAVVCATTAIYSLDLWFKFAAMNYKVIPFIKTYWLDILFLIPICKLFRGFRILKVGNLLRVSDAACDFTEIAFRISSAIKANHNRNHGTSNS